MYQHVVSDGTGAGGGGYAGNYVGEVVAICNRVFACHGIPETIDGDCAVVIIAATVQPVAHICCGIGCRILEISHFALCLVICNIGKIQRPGPVTIDLTLLVLQYFQNLPLLSTLSSILRSLVEVLLRGLTRLLLKSL